MYELISSLPEQIKKALELELVNFSPKTFEDVNKAVFMGMGGSGIAGDMCRDIIGTIPILQSKGYDVPGFLDNQTLAVVISYSGNTKETLESFHKAVKKNCRVLGITSGGKLLELLAEEGKPHIKLPVGMPPRASLPYQLFSLLNFFDKLGFYNLDKGIAEFAEKIKPEADEKAKSLAPKLKGKMPFIYGTIPSACLRMKVQMNENSKMHAKWEVYPELNHNEIVGWQGHVPKEVAVLFLRDKDDKQEIADSMEFLKAAIKEKTHVFDIEVRGSSKLEKLVYLVFFGDLLSYYLAVHAGVDPGPVEYINTLKKIIKE